MSSRSRGKGGDKSRDRPLRIAFVIGTLSLAGSELQLTRLACELKSRGHEVNVLALGVSRSGVLADVLDAAGVPLRSFGFTRIRDDRQRIRPWAAMRELAKFAGFVRVVMSLRLDVCHAYLFHPYALALPVAVLARVPVRASGRRGMSAGFPLGRLHRVLQRLSNMTATVVIANSESIAEEVRLTERFPAENVVVIANGVDLPDHAADAGAEPPVGVMVANLIAYKGHRDLVEALAIMRDPPQVRLLGEGPERCELEEMIESRGLSRRCLLEGSVVDAKRAYLDGQFALLTSHTEGLPNAILEAMAAGLPVVATRVGGVPSLVEDGVTGITVPPRSPESLAVAIARLVAEPDLRVSMGRAARERAYAYRWDRCVDAHISVYRGARGNGSA